MTDVDRTAARRALTKLLRGLPSNLIATDLDDVSVLRVLDRNFEQQPDGGGLHISFSISYHALGKMGAAGHEAMEQLVRPVD